jgi:hypothetical protein
MKRSSPLPSRFAEKAPESESDIDAGGATSTMEDRPARRRPFKNQVAAVTRWLHIYLSMFGLGTVLFFGLTGITLNHPDWVFGGAEVVVQVKGQVELRWLNPDPGKSDPRADSNTERPVMKLEVVEHLRKEHGIRGALAEFKVDDREAMVTFKGPGYSADAFIDRETGQYTLTESRHGFLAVINDLHKGRDTGPAWAVVIDISAGLMVAISLTGLVLLFYIKRRRIPGTIIGLVGTAALAAMYWFWVP